MKRVWLLLLVSALLIGTFGVVCSAAAEPSYSIWRMSDAGIYEDDTVEVGVYISANPGIISLRFEIAYDTEVLELQSVSDQGILNGFTTPSPTITSPYTLRWADSLATENNTASGFVAILTFKALQPADETQISVTHKEARNVNGTKVTFADSGCTFSVKEKATTTSGTFGDNLQWTFDGNGVLTISGTGTMPFAYDAPWNSFRQDIKKAVIEEGVTSLGDYAFDSCINMTQVQLAESITAIGRYAFRYAGITELAIGNNVTKIDDGAFASCEALENVSIGTGVKSIGVTAFTGCDALETVTIPGNVETIGDLAFVDCASLSEVTMEEGVASIGYQAFAECPALKNVILGEGVTTIGNNVFNGDPLSTVIYGGTQAQWENIAVGEYNEALENATVLYTGEIKLSNAAPTLYDNIAMNYKANKTRFDELGITDPYLVVSFNGTEITLTDYTVSEDGKQYIFTFYNIAPNQMDDTLTATLYATYGDDVYEGATLEYSVATYCYRMLNNSAVVNNDAYAELRTLLVDLLHYGAMAQKFTGFAGETVDARLTEAQLAWGTTGTPALESKTSTSYATVENPTASWTNVGLVLEDAVTMRFKFRTDSTAGLKVKITSDTNAEGWVIDAADFQYEEGTGKYYVDFSGFHAGQMRESVYVTVYNGDTAVSNTLRYTIESYAYKYQTADATQYPYFAELVKAMMRYGDAAYNFAN